MDEVPAQRGLAAPPIVQLSGPDRWWAMASHLGALVAFCASGCLGWVPPLAILVVGGRRPGPVRDAAVESLNFQLTVLLVELALAPVLIVGFVVLAQGPFLLPLLAVPPILLASMAFVLLAVVLMLLASIETGCGGPYRYPFRLRLVR